MCLPLIVYTVEATAFDRRCRRWSGLASILKPLHPHHLLLHHHIQLPSFPLPFQIQRCK